MKKVCSWCGKIHEKGYICPRKPIYQKKTTDKDKFRWKSIWQKKRNEIKQRDLNMCQLCCRGLYSSDGIEYNSEVQVHHIVPLEVDFSKRLDNYNLICLCSEHHELAENNTINKDELINIAYEQEKKYSPLPF